ncbi:MAG: ABC transporter permease [Desulfurococcaceae archaeon]|nr:ABC transporter permease [Desulfurococcaceae archaeon]
MPITRTYLAKRILLLFLVAFGVLIISFIITRVIPARPELLWVGIHARAEQIERARKELHLDEPIHIQLYYYLADFFRGNWGVSWRTRQPVILDIITSLPATLELTITAFILAFIIGVILGLIAAINYGKVIDKVISVFSIIAASIPVFWLGLVLQTIFSIWYPILPGGMRVDPSLVIGTGFKPITNFYILDSLIQLNFPVLLDVLKRMILPVITLMMYPLGLTIRMTRSMAIESLQEIYVKALEVWGLPRSKMLYKYVLKNVIAPVIASLGLSFGYTITGALMVELIFVYPGIGYYVGMALLSFDYPAILGGIVFVAIIYSLVNLVVDIIHAWIDPRVKF